MIVEYFGKDNTTSDLNLSVKGITLQRTAEILRHECERRSLST